MEGHKDPWNLEKDKWQNLKSYELFYVITIMETFQST
jgi:hypothetical protein